MIAPLDAASLAACLSDARDRAARTGRPVLASWSRRCGDRDPIAVFAATAAMARPACLWAIPQQGVWMVGLGQAEEFRAAPGSRWMDLQRAWRRLADAAVNDGGHRIALCGGFAFDPETATHPAWRDFPAGLLTLPRYHVCATGGDVRLTVNALVDDRTDCARSARQLIADWSAMAAGRAGGGHGIADPGTPPVQDTASVDWMRTVTAAVAAIRAGDLHKVVLARSRTMPVRTGLGAAIGALWSAQPDAYVFAFTRGRSCFLGASPERLIDVHDGQIRTCALAGSAPRGEDRAEDDRLGAALQASAKDRHEHQLVIDGLRDALAPVCDVLNIPAGPQLRKLNHVQHLMTPIAGTLAAGVQLLDLMQRLHPTAAVGGLPRERALPFIRDHEGLDRGWYAGPVGWIDDRGDGEFAVALRSGLLRDGYATLFAGCGIVQDSQAETELLESQVKMRSMATALGAGHDLRS